jgi:aquaporin NIP
MPVPQEADAAKPLNMRKYLAEFLGTFAMVFCGTGAIIINQESNGAITHLGIAITFGLIVMVMIYALGAISGAHFNPAVTLSFYISGSFERKEILPYWASQFFGAIAASGLLRFLFPDNLMLGATMPAGSDLQAFIFELLLSYFLMLVIIHVARGSKEQGMFAGLAIGATVLLEALFAGPVCGASMNPWRSLAPALASGHTEHIWIYLTAPFLGAALAVLNYKFLNTPTESGAKSHHP